MDLVPPGAIKQALLDVDAYLKTTYPRFRAAFDSPAFYFDKRKPMLTYCDDQLTVYVRIPVVSVYEVLSFPVPMNMGAETPKDALQIVGLPAHVAVSLTRRYYIPLVNVNWAGCYGQTIVMCKDLPYMKKVDHRTCIAALLRQDKAEIAKRCVLDCLLNPDFGEMAIYLNGGDVLVVSAEKEGQLICGNLPAVQKQIENHAKIRIGWDCAFWTKGAWIPYSLRACHVWPSQLPWKGTPRGTTKCPYLAREHDRAPAERGTNNDSRRSNTRKHDNRHPKGCSGIRSPSASHRPNAQNKKT